MTVENISRHTYVTPDIKLGNSSRDVTRSAKVKFNGKRVKQKGNGEKIFLTNAILQKTMKCYGLYARVEFRQDNFAGRLTFCDCSAPREEN